MTYDYKIKVVTGYDLEQHLTINAEEAHKAYYLFLNPEKRGIFSNGIALRGKDIQTILPDYHATMGWHATHQLDSDDFEDMKNKGVDKKLKQLMEKARNVAQMIDQKPELANIPLSHIPDIENELRTGISERTKRIADKMNLNISEKE